jgi:hypothetical protein
MKPFLFLLVLLSLPQTFFSQPKPIAFTGATIYPVSSPPIQNGTL